MSTLANADQARMRGMLDTLQQQDPDITNIVNYSKFVVAYLLQQDGPNPGWRKANIEGPVYLVRRNTLPRYKLMVKNQFNTSDLADSLHPDWELDCQKNYVFYKIEDSTERIRGLWFHDDAERQKIEASLEQTLEAIRSGQEDRQPENQSRIVGAGAHLQAQGKARQGQLDGPAVSPPMNNDNHMDHKGAPYPGIAVEQAQTLVAAGPLQQDALYSQFGLRHNTEQDGSQDSVTVTPASLRSALHALADDDQFIRMVMQKLSQSQ